MTSPLDTYKSAILGVPYDADKKPSKQGAVKAFAEMQTQLEAAQAGALVKDTLANLQALTSVSEASIMAWVTNDSTNANNGIYENTGTASAPAWTRRTSIPQFMITGINVDAGTANAIQITTDLPVPTEDGRALIAVPINEDTTADVTLSINGETPLQVLTSNGNQISVGNLVAGKYVLGVIVGTNFQLLSDVETSATLTAVEAVFNDMDTRYLGGKASAPTTDNAGNALIEGATYFNTTEDQSYVWTGLVWQSYSATPNDSVNFAKFTSELASEADVLFTVASSGADFTNLNDAVKQASKLQNRPYIANGITVEVRMLAGFSMSEQILVDGIDLSFIKITQVDASTTIVRSALTTSMDTRVPREPAFGVNNGGKLPIIAALFNMDTSGTADAQDGILATNGSWAMIEDNVGGTAYGITNAGGDGCSAQKNSHIVAHVTNFSNAVGSGFHAGRESSIDCSLSTATGCNYGIQAWRCSTVDAYSTTDLSGAITHAIYAHNRGEVDALAPDCSGAGSHAIYALSASTVNVANADATGAGGDGVRCQAGSTVNIAGGDVSGATGNGLYSLYGSTIAAQNCDASECTGNGCYAIGAEIVIIGGTARKTLGVDSSNDLVVAQGGVIKAANCDGGTNVVSANTIYSTGIIYQ